MASEKADQVNAVVRIGLPTLLPRPTGDFRRRAWRRFAQALDRHLAGKPEVRPVQRPR